MGQMGHLFKKRKAVSFRGTAMLSLTVIVIPLFIAVIIFDSYTVFQEQASLRESRENTLRMYQIQWEETLEIELRQVAATEEYEYVLPVIFHVLYRVPEDDVPVGYLSSCLERVNELYRDGPVDMNLKFVLATHDPNGQLLEEPGVRREFREALQMDMLDFVGN